MNNKHLSEEEERFKNILLIGKESATRLRTLLRKPPVMEMDYGSGFSSSSSSNVDADGLAVKIFDSFTQTLSMVNLDSFDANEPNPKVCDGNKKKRLSPTDRQGYKRRNVNESRIEVSTTTDDGYAWRKYGQKDILYSDTPRCYYRCSHKYDQGCQATKHIQKIPQDSPLYRITYFGHHTCNNTSSKSPKIIDSCLLSFESNPETIPNSTRTLSSTYHIGCGDKPHLLTWKDVIAFDSSRNTRMMTATTSEFGSTKCLEDVVSSSFATQEAFGVMDLMDFNNLENEICFDESDFY